MEKTVFGVFDQVQHKLACTVMKERKREILKFSIYEEQVLYYPSSENKGANQLCGYCTADMRLCFRILK